MQIKIASFLYIGNAAGKGRGVFTRKDIPPMETIEISSVLVMDAAARKLLDQTRLHDYIFEWGEEVEECCVAWGYVSLYNHSYTSNCEYFMDFEQQLITVKSVRKILKGEELTLNYNGDWDQQKPVWFDAQ
jgi:SET domain-containing protein